MEDLYEVLGVLDDASLEDIKKNYHILVKKYHPDVVSNTNVTDRIQQINYAYNILSDSIKRKNMMNQEKNYYMKILLLKLRQMIYFTVCFII